MTLEAIPNQKSFEESSEMSGYFRHFSFKRDPFGIEDKEASLYLLPNWEQQIDLMLHYIRNENVLLVLTGPKGIGKTTLVNFFLLEAIHGFSPTETAVQSDLVSGEFLVQLGDAVRTCQMVADNALKPDQILEAMASAFDISTEHFLGSFENQSDVLLDNLQYSKQSCVLLIDEAHELPDSTLELLLHMVSQQSEHQHRFHAVLIGESLLKKRLAKMSKSKDYSGVTYFLELDPLNLSQTEYYLKHRFSAAGRTEDTIFSNGVMNKIYKLSGGVPKMINQLAKQSLLEMLKKKKFSSLSAIFKPYKKTFIGGGFLLASFAMILMYLGQDVTLRTQHPRLAGHEAITQKKPMISADLPKITQPKESLPSTTEVAKSLPTVQPEPQTALPNQVIQPKTSVEPSQQSQVQVPVLPSKSVIEASSLIDPDSAPLSEDSEVKAPLLLPSQKSTIKKSVKVKSTVQEPDKQESDIKPARHKLEEEVYTQRFMKKNPAHYTLKLREVTSEAAGKAFIAKHKLGRNASYYSIHSQGVDKYEVVYGEYADAETAKRALLLLPKSLLILSPKPCRIGIIQASLR